MGALIRNTRGLFYSCIVNLFIVEPEEVVDGCVTITEEMKVNHLKKVLKVELGSTVKMGVLNGMLYVAHVIEIGAKSYRFRLEPVEGSEFRDEANSVCLLLGTPRPNMIKSISVVSATMGVDELLFIRSERVDKSYFQSKMLADEAMKKNLIHGAEQGVIRRLPRYEKHPHQTLEAFLTDSFPAWEQRVAAAHPEQTIVKLIAEPKVPMNIVEAICSAGAASPPYVVLAIGPEGGWIPPEVELLEQHGFIPFHCGDRILCTETAVIALLAQVELAKELIAANGQLAPLSKRSKSSSSNNN